MRWFPRVRRISYRVWLVSSESRPWVDHYTWWSHSRWMCTCDFSRLRPGHPSPCKHKFWVYSSFLSRSMTELESVPGIGEAYAEKLKEEGIESVEELLAAKIEDVAAILGVSPYRARKIVNAAKEVMIAKLELHTAGELQRMWDERRMRYSTGSSALDAILGGGVPTDAITQVVGPFSSGKTQLCFSVGVSCLQKGRKVGWIETEPSIFSLHRMRQIAEARGVELDPNRDVYVVPHDMVNSPQQQMMAYELIDSAIRKKGVDIGLLVIDSFIARFRQAYAGRESLRDRSEELARHFGFLEYMASAHNMAILITGQVMGIPDAGMQLRARARFGEPMSPVGGEYYLHSATYNIFLNQVATEKWEAVLFDAPDLPRAKAEFVIDEGGIRDVGAVRRKPRG